MKPGDTVKVLCGLRKGELGMVKHVLQFSKLVLVAFKDGLSAFYGFSEVEVVKDLKSLLKSRIGD